MKPKDKPEDRAKIEKNDSPSPMTYDVEKAYKRTQVIDSKFVMSKSKINSFADIQAKSRNFVPGVGSYKTEEAYSKITLGVSKGWK